MILTSPKCVNTDRTEFNRSMCAVVERPDLHCGGDDLVAGYNWVRMTESRIVNYVSMLEIRVNYPANCQWSCFNDDSCDSVNYRPLDFTCQLVTNYEQTAVNQTDIIEDPQWEFWHTAYTDVV